MYIYAVYVILCRVRTGNKRVCVHVIIYIIRIQIGIIIIYDYYYIYIRCIDCDGGSYNKLPGDSVARVC